MEIIYTLKGTKEYKKIYVRLYHNKLDLPVSTDLICRTEDWNPESEQFHSKKMAKTNRQLLQLKENLKDAFNIDFSSGTIIDRAWMKNIIAETFLRPKKEEKLINYARHIYLIEFGNYWLKNEAKTWLNVLSRILSKREINQKEKALSQFEEYQNKKNIKIKLTGFDTQQIKGFYSFLRDKGYSASTAKKTLGEIKFLCKRAKEMKVNVCLDFESNIILINDDPSIEDTYLSVEEINRIFAYDFNTNDAMDIIRDNFILSLWTGLRINDLRNVSSNDIADGMLHNISQKTKTLVKIPLHPHVKFILNKRLGNLPPKVNKDEYNIQIKEICRLCGINAMTIGKVFDTDKERKILGRYPKYKLITSHTARRSFATNLSKILSRKAVTKLGGWNSEKMTAHYDKETLEEIAKDLENIWNTEKM